MHITELHLKNFQKHKDLTIKFTQGINAITGETGKGKSAIIRALYLLLENSPRNANKIFHRKKSVGPLEIVLKDSGKNEIKRTKREYILNKTKLKAFKHEVPKPIKDLWPTKAINWQRQFDQHYLVFATPGNAAKSLAASTGIEEQENILKSIKEELSDTKSELKRAQKNKDECEEKEKSLRDIPRLLKKALEVNEILSLPEAISEEIEVLEDALKKLEKFNIALNPKEYEGYIERVNDVFSLICECKEIDTQINNLLDIERKIKETAKTNPSIFQNYLSQVSEIIDIFKDVQATESKIAKLNKHLERLHWLETQNSELSQIIKEKEKEEKSVLKDMEICPLCERKM